MTEFFQGVSFLAGMGAGLAVAILFVGSAVGVLTYAGRKLGLDE